MSKALNYLASVRPEAATHLLGFYKHSVKALDDKTRHLIQIVTKVTVGTERGLRQYAPKALKAGASKEEILDAVMMAFPAAGLPKVLEALEILREMDLLPEPPGVKEEIIPGEVVLARLEGLELRRMTCVHAPAGDVILFRTGEDAVRAYRNKCPHSRANLCKGTDHGDRVECKVHNWVFDLASGRCLNHEGQPGLAEVSVRVVAGEVRIA